MRRLASVAAFCGTLALAASAQANGRFPYASQLVVDPGDDKRLVLRTTYGILQTFDGGKTWVWLCETAVGYGGLLDPPLGVTKSGTTLAGIFTGLSVSTDRGCGWSIAPGPLAKEFVIDLAVEPKDPTRAVAITSTGLGAEGFHVIVAETLDDGKTWKQAGVDLPKDFNCETIDVAPSNPDRLYASGVSGSPRAGFLERSDDRGKTWSRFPIDLAGARAPFIAAVDPIDPDLLYVRLDGEVQDRVIMSADGGKTWKDIYSSKGDLLGFALSPDGSRLAVGGPADGLLLASRGEYAFKSVQSATGVAGKTLGARCLTWTTAGLYACASEYPDGFTVGLSKDEGKTFLPLYHLSELSELKCPAGTSTALACPTLWPTVQDTIGQERDAGPSANPDASSDAPGSSTTPAKSSNGCHCRASRAPSSERGTLALSMCVSAWAATLLLRRLNRRCRRDLP